MQTTIGTRKESCRQEMQVQRMQEDISPRQKLQKTQKVLNINLFFHTSQSVWFMDPFLSKYHTNIDVQNEWSAA